MAIFAKSKIEIYVTFKYSSDSLFIYQDENEDENQNQSFRSFFYSMFWNKPVTNEPIIICSVILSSWFVRHRH